MATKKWKQLADWKPTKDWKPKSGETTIFVYHLSRHVSLEVWACSDYNQNRDVWMTGIRWRTTLISFPKHFAKQSQAIAFLNNQFYRLYSHLDTAYYAKTSY